MYSRLRRAENCERSQIPRLLYRRAVEDYDGYVNHDDLSYMEIQAFNDRIGREREVPQNYTSRTWTAESEEWTRTDVNTSKQKVEGRT